MSTEVTDELALIRWLRQRIAPADDVVLGPGDDCALLQTAAGLVAATTDTLLQGTHFSETDTGAAVGWKAVAASLSDLAAMGCRARWILVGLGLRRGVDPAWTQAFAEGLCHCCEVFHASLVGGDITTGEGPTSIAVTALGTPHPGGPIRRSAARPGDLLVVTGQLGGSLLGRHLSFTPRLAEAQALCASGAVHAMLDLSDGLALDLRRLCQESGVGACLEETAIPCSAAARQAAARSGRDVLEHALGDGEDFELLCAVEPSRWGALQTAWTAELAPLTILGKITGEPNVLTLCQKNGVRAPVPALGFVHALH